MEAKQILAAKMAVHAVLSTLAESDESVMVPEGPIFLALQSQGCTLGQFNSLVGGMEGAGLVEREGHQMAITARGRASCGELARQIQSMQGKAGGSRGAGIAEGGLEQGQRERN